MICVSRVLASVIVQTATYPQYQQPLWCVKRPPRRDVVRHRDDKERHKHAHRRLIEQQLHGGTVQEPAER